MYTDRAKPRCSPARVWYACVTEKLLKLKSMMKTEAGRRMAEGRHRTMERFLAVFYAEWDGTQ